MVSFQTWMMIFTSTKNNRGNSETSQPDFSKNGGNPRTFRAWWKFPEKQTKIPGLKKKSLEVENKSRSWTWTIFLCTKFSHVNEFSCYFPDFSKNHQLSDESKKHVSDYIPSSDEQPTSALVVKIALEVVEPAGVRTEGSDLKSFDNRGSQKTIPPGLVSKHILVNCCVSPPLFKRSPGRKSCESQISQMFGFLTFATFDVWVRINSFLVKSHQRVQCPWVSWLLWNGKAEWKMRLGAENKGYLSLGTFEVQ